MPRQKPTHCIKGCGTLLTPETKVADITKYICRECSNKYQKERHHARKTVTDTKLSQASPFLGKTMLRGVCQRCTVILENPKGLYCPDCQILNKKDKNKRSNAKRGTGSHRLYNIKSKYGLDYDPVTPDSKCEICESTERLCVDHDHNTGKYRGVLCHGGNTFLGKLEPRLNELHKFMEYLNDSRSIEN